MTDMTDETLDAKAAEAEARRQRSLMLDQIIADIELKLVQNARERAQTDRTRQEYQFAPWQMLIAGTTAAGVLIGGTAAFIKIFG